MYIKYVGNTSSWKGDVIMQLEELATYLKKYRKENLLTQNQMAEKLSISRSHYSDIENGRYNPSYQLLLRISRNTNFFNHE